MASKKVIQNIDKQKLTAAIDVSKGHSKVAIALLLVLVVIGAVEFFLSPVEIAIGEYMKWTRPVRPQTGLGWDLGKEGEIASQTLGQIAEELKRRNTAAMTVKDWSDIPIILEKYDAIPLSTEQFIELYLTIPTLLREDFLSSLELFRIRTSGKWYRVYLLNESGSVRIFFVDKGNVVLLQKKLSPFVFERWNQMKEPVAGAIDSLEPFYGRVFSAKRFFESIVPAGSVNLRGIDAVFNQGFDGNLQRVGIAADSKDGYTMIGLEFLRADGELVVHRIFVPRADADLLFEVLVDRSLFEEMML